MTHRATPSLVKWPFMMGDLLLLALAGLIVNRSPDSFAFWPLGCLVVCVALGAWIAVYPFLAEYRAAIRMAESEGLNEAAAKIGQMESVAQKIGEATSQWQDIQNQATQTSSAARSITEQMASEAKAFAEFMKNTNDSEKAHLRLEVEKLKRSENDWIQTLVMLMDHVYGIYAAAVRSGKQPLIAQLSQYQRACREVVRRVGLVPVDVKDGEPYQETAHQLADPEGELPESPVIGLTLATGYTYQGKVIRKPLVSLQKEAAPAASDEQAPAPVPKTGDLFQLESQPAQSSVDTPGEIEPEINPPSEEENAARSATNPF